MDPREFQSTLGPKGDHVHVIARLREEIHAAQEWASSFLPQSAVVRHTLAAFRAVALRCAPDAPAALEQRPEVIRVEPDLRVRALLENSVLAVGVPPLWEEGLTGKGVRLAILDTGIDRGHPDFEGRVLVPVDFTGAGVRDDVGHGTFVASVAVGSGEASRGRYRGMAPAAHLLVARVLNSRGEGRMSDVIAGLGWALARDARVINLSLGTLEAGRADDALSSAAAEVAKRGVVVCAASGPSGARWVGSPACAPEVFRVTGQGGEEDSAALRAPESPAVAAQAFGTSIGRPAGDKYVEAAGSSAASAYVAGICALLLEAVPDATPEEVRAALAASQRGEDGGRRSVNAMAALAELRATRQRR